PQKLAAFVLHFHRAVEEHRMLVQRGLLAQSHAERRVARRRRLDLVEGEAVENALARRLERVDAKIERCGALQSARELEERRLVHAAPELGDHPVGQVRAYLERKL